MQLAAFVGYLKTGVVATGLLFFILFEKLEFSRLDDIKAVCWVILLVNEFAGAVRLPLDMVENCFYGILFEQRPEQ